MIALTTPVTALMSPNRNAAPLLQVKNLRTWFRADDETVRAVDGASFHIGAGETFCLVGESGSGKSVSALSVMGLLPADRGSLYCPNSRPRLSPPRSEDAIDPNLSREV